MNLMVKVGQGYRQATRDEVQEAAARYVAQAAVGRTLMNPADSKEFLREMIGTRACEVFACVFLDSRHRVLAVRELFRGTLTGASVHPREVVREALEMGAASVVLGHNHPSNHPEPSRADEEITLRLRDALSLFDIALLDHLVIAAGGCTSLAERGIL